MRYGLYLDTFRNNYWDSNFNVLIKPVLSLFASKVGNKQFRHLLIDKK